MLIQKIGFFIIAGATALPIAVIGVSTVSADSKSANYNFLVGSGFICDSNDSTTCPDVTRAASGETIELSGAGTLSLANKSVAGAGAYTLKSPSREVRATGIWTATELLSFKSYGIAPGTLMRQGHKFKPSRLARLGLEMLAGPMPTGGLALLRIRLLPDAGSPKEALLQVNCAKGKVPENQPGDGIRLAIQEGGPKFDETVSGRTLFLLRKPGFKLP